MKTTWKWIPVLALAAMTVRAQQDFPADAPGEGVPPPPPPCERRMMPPHGREGRRPLPPPCMPEGGEPCGKPPRGMAGDAPDRGGPPEMTAERRAKFEAFRQLRHDVRAETDEAKKAELVERLRAALGEMADEQNAMQKERLAAAEKRIAVQKARLDAQVGELKAMIEDAEAHRGEWIEEQVRLILSGERPPMHHMRPGAERPEGHGPGREGRPFPKWRMQGPEDCPKDCGKGFGGGRPCGRDGAGEPPPPPPEELLGGEEMPPPEGEAE